MKALTIFFERIERILGLKAFSWATLGLLLLVILWGAYVRASVSGAGCGDEWPLCQGSVLPSPSRIETVIEFTHRATSGLSFIAVVLMVGLVWRAYSGGSRVRKAAGASLFFMITEVLIGALLVKLKLVEYDKSSLRAIVISLHLINTLFLIGAVSLVAWWSSQKETLQKIRDITPFTFSVIVLIVGTVLGVSGALTALGDTLFPVKSVAEGIAQDLDPTAHFLISLRIAHPFIAVVWGVLLITYSAFARRYPLRKEGRLLSFFIPAVFMIQLVLGFANILLLAPAWMQLLHLGVADVLWILVVLLSSELWTMPRRIELTCKHSTASTITTE